MLTHDEIDDDDGGGDDDGDGGGDDGGDGDAGGDDGGDGDGDGDGNGDGEKMTLQSPGSSSDLQLGKTSPARFINPKLFLDNFTIDVDMSSTDILTRSGHFTPESRGKKSRRAACWNTGECRWLG